MRLILLIVLAGTALSGCQKCDPSPSGGIAVGVGSDGVQSGAAVGASCGNFSIGMGSGNFWEPYWY